MRPGQIKNGPDYCWVYLKVLEWVFLKTPVILLILLLAYIGVKRII